MIALIGATGRTGRQVLAQADGPVRALVRDRGRLPGVDVIEGDPREADDVARLVEGADIVICAVGGEGDTRTRVARALVAAGPRRLVMIGNAGVLPGPDGGLRGEDGPEEFREVFLDHRGAFETLRASSLDWRLLCPPFIVDGAATGTALTAVEAYPKGAGGRVTTGELARVALSVARAEAPSRVRIGVADVTPSRAA